jgi:uncharacterized membrane protein
MTWYEKLILIAVGIFGVWEWLFVMNLFKKEKDKQGRKTTLDDRLGSTWFLYFIAIIILAVIYLWIKD